MIALMAASFAVTNDTDFDALGKAVTGCDRTTVADTVTNESNRRMTFLIDAYAEQRDIAVQRAEVAERRRASHAPPPSEKSATRTAERAAKPAENEPAFAQATEALDDRQHALDDARTLDRLRQEMISYFRQLYLARCPASGK